MPFSSPPTASYNDTPEQSALFKLWGELATYPAAQWECALLHLMNWMASEIQADNVIWIGALRVLRGKEAEEDPFIGWRLRGRLPLHPDPEPYQRQLAAYYTREHYGKLTPTYYQRSHHPQKEAHVGITSRASMEGAGTFRVHRLRDGWIDFAEFSRSLHYKLYYDEAGIRDRIWIGFPVDPDRESCFLLDRIQKPGDPKPKPFTIRQSTLVGNAVRGIPEMHRRFFLGNGLLSSDKPLSPTEREILQGLLTEKTEKQIALSTGQKAATLHKYVTNLYARFGVRSRAALMDLWLSGTRPEGKAAAIDGKSLGESD